MVYSNLIQELLQVLAQANKHRTPSSRTVDQVMITVTPKPGSVEINIIGLDGSYPFETDLQTIDGVGGLRG